MSSSKGKKWIRIFQIPQYKTHPAGHTIYQVTCSTFPVESPEDVTTVSTWKRFSQLQVLHKNLSTVHKQLYLHGNFPLLLETSFFNRKQPEVIEARRVWILELLEFLASQPLLNNHPAFTNFLFDLDEPGDTSSEGSCDRVPLGGPRSPSPDNLISPELQTKVTEDLSLDATPTLQPTVMAMLKEDVEEVIKNEEQEEVVVGQVTDEEEAEPLTHLVSEMPESDIPAYIAEAAELILSALSFEAEERLEESVAAYREAIGKLLSEVQGDPDVTRQAQVKRRIAQYISKAEQIVKRGREVKKMRSKVPGIPHLQLFGQLADLRNYRVRGVMAGKIILAEEAGTKNLVVFKTLHKAPAVYKKTKTSLLPINIAYMVKLLKYFETDDCVYLMLEYCSAGKLWDVVRPLVRQQQETLMATSLIDSNTPHQEEKSGRTTPLKRQTSVLKPSASFIRDRQKSVRLSEGDSDSDSLGELSVVHSGLSGLLVVEGGQIEHFDKVTDEEQPAIHRAQNPVVRSSQAMLETVSKTLSASKEAWTEGSSVLDQLDTIEDRIKQHMQGNLVVEEAIPAISSQSPQPPSPTQQSPIPPLTPTPPPRPPVLRTLSELLPQCPIEELQDATLLPDRLIRTWAAELAQVLASLHYREILIKDLNPENVLLDQHGHVKLTYQCEWVSVDTGLNGKALEENYCAPEVISAGDLTPAADWWSYGALLHLLYCGAPPASAHPTGVDASIPLHFPEKVPPDAAAFIGDLLQPTAEVRLGAGSRGSNDVRLHPYFGEWDWDKMSWR